MGAPFDWDNLHQGAKFVITDADVRGYEEMSPSFYDVTHASWAEVCSQQLAYRQKHPNARIFEHQTQQVSLWPIGIDCCPKDPV